MENVCLQKISKTTEENTMKNYQIIWSRNWVGVGRNKPYSYRPGEKWYGSVYAGGLRLGFLEIRKWGNQE